MGDMEASERFNAEVRSFLMSLQNQIDLEPAD
jgi:hypothetical protein